jgi:hypothetical protein
VLSHRGEWITGGDWDHQGWQGGQLPRREWIDSFTADTPVFVQRLDGHMALANSLALSRAGITPATANPVGGSIERDPATGEPTGILKDAAMDLVAGIIPKDTPSDIMTFARRAMNHAAVHGVTSVHDITLPEQFDVFETLEQDHALTCRIYSRLPIAGYAALIGKGVRHAHGTDRLKIGSLKAFSDGSLGSGTALFFDPYDDEPGNTGLAMDIVTDGRLRAWAIEADRHQFQLSVHAIGDKANDIVLSIFEEISAKNPPWDRRFRIEHAQHVRPADIDRFRKLGVIVSAQPFHCIDDGVWAERRIGSARARTSFAFRSFIDAGVTVCFGSDWTVAPLDPLAGIYAAVTRSTVDGRRPGGWVPAQKITVEEALRCYTVNNAYASFEESVKGSIEVGKLADFVVLSEDILFVDPSRIREARVDLTVFDGHIVYER